MSYERKDAPRICETEGVTVTPHSKFVTDADTAKQLLVNNESTIQVGLPSSWSDVYLHM